MFSKFYKNYKLGDPITLSKSNQDKHKGKITPRHTVIKSFKMNNKTKALKAVRVKKKKKDIIYTSGAKKSNHRLHIRNDARQETLEWCVQGVETVKLEFFQIPR